MKYYIGSPKWLYYCLQRHYFDTFESYYGIINEEEFINKVSSGSVYKFTFRIYSTSTNNLSNDLS
jgi:hypothetical protein